MESWLSGYIRGYYAVSIEAEGEVLPPVEEPLPDPARPLNDDFMHALALSSGVQTNTVNLVDATLEPWEPYTGTNMTRTVWYQWRSSIEGEFEASVNPANGAMWNSG